MVSKNASFSNISIRFFLFVNLILHSGKFSIFNLSLGYMCFIPKVTCDRENILP